MESQLRIAIIGCGGIAKGHPFTSFEGKLDAMKNLPAKPVATVDIDESRARQYAEEYGADRYHTKTEDALTDDVDAAIICLPHYLHRDSSYFF